MADEIPYSKSRLSFTRIDDNDLQQLFDLDGLRQRLFERSKSEREQDWPSVRSRYLNASAAERSQMLFAHRLLASYGSSLNQIRYLLNSTPPDLWQDAITEHRQELIDRLAGTDAGKHWMRCMRKSDGWKFTAAYLWSEQSAVSSEAIDHFFRSLDEICILTDLLEGKAETYGLDFKPELDEALDVMRHNFFKTEGITARELLKRLQRIMEGKEKPKSKVMPLRAATDAGIMKKPTYEEYKKAFDPEGKVSKSTYNENMNPYNKPYEDEAFKQLVKEFEQLL